MKSKTLLLFALLPLVGVSLAYLLDPATPSFTEAAALPPFPPKKSPPAAVSNAHPPTEGMSDEEREQRSLARINAGLAKLATLMTPEALKEESAGVVRFRKPQYDALFESWHLDAASSERVLEIVRNRIYLVDETQRKQYETGLSGIRESQAQTHILGEDARRQLRLILGDSRTDEFSRLEDRIRAEGVQGHRLARIGAGD